MGIDQGKCVSGDSELKFNGISTPKACSQNA